MENKLQPLLAKAAEAWQVTTDNVVQLLTLQHTKAVRINALKAKKTTLRDIKALGVELEPIAWCKNAYRVISGYDKLSSSKLFNSGEFILQDPSSFVPVLALSPQPGEAILDICAAPGGKTSHIAAITKNKARLTANDTSRIRFFKMREIFERYGVQAETTLYDGRFMRKQFAGQQFDKILLDAPCSGEAAINPNRPKTYEQWSPSKVKRLSRLQEQLIMVAYDLLKPGGTLVYSTCTIAPEENECVVDYLLKRRKAVIEPFNIDIDNARNGLVEWHGKKLNSEISKTYRLLPSDLHEAFYTAKITKPLTDIEDEDTYMPTKQI